MTNMGLTVSADGTLPNGGRSWSYNTERSAWVLPDWSIVDSPGRLYTRWGAGGRAGMELTPSVRAGASIPDTRSYASGSEVSVRVWRTWNDYRDVTEMLDADNGMPVVKKAENAPGSIALALDADWETPSANPLSERFAGWQYLVASSGDDSPGPIRPGYYVTVHALEGTAWVPVAEGWITTLQPEAGRLRVECADGLAVLAHQGATLRRNYYRERTLLVGDASYADGTLRGSLSALPSDGTLDQESYQWLVEKTWYGSSRINGSVTERGTRYISPGLYVSLTYKSPIRCRLTKIVTHVANQELLTMAECFVRVRVGPYVDDPYYDTETRILGAFQSQDLEFQWHDEQPEVEEGQEITFEWWARATSGSSETMHIHHWFGPNEGAPIQCTCITRGDAGYSAKGEAPDWAITAYEYARAEGTVDGQYVEITGIAGTPGLDEEELYTPSAGRFLYAAYRAEQDRDEIMPDIAISHKALPFMVGSTDARVGVYRIGGGNVLQYLQRIAGMAGDDGLRRTITARGYTVMAIASGVKHERTDAPMIRACWRKDASGVPTDAVEFVSFAPKMTLKGRPSLAVLRGSWAGEEAMPMMVAVEDAESSAQRGLVLETSITDSGASDVASAMRTAWASLNADGLDVWEGVLTLPGFLPGLIERSGAHAGAGAVIELYDERYGLSGYRVLVKEVRADWGKRTTEVVVSSYSPAYASTVPDTAAAVQMAGDLSTGSGLLYKTQYVRAVLGTTLSDAEMTVEVSVDGGVWWRCRSEDVSVGRTPTRTIVTARIMGTAAQCTDTTGRRWAVSKVRLQGSVVVDLDPYRRPDLYTGQVLIVQVDAPRS